MRSDSALISLVKRAAKYGADIIKRGAMTIGWAFNPRNLRFYVVVFVAGVCRQMVKLRPEEFGRMFSRAPHWI
jgi:hypothetical protein